MTNAELRAKLTRYNPWDRDKWARLTKPELLAWCEYYEVDWEVTRALPATAKWTLLQSLIAKHRAANPRKPRARKPLGPRR